jgi:hypothetical protein
MFEHFYYEAIRKTVIAFGTLFNNIYIKHKNDEGRVVSTQKVSFAYGPTQKFLARLEQSPDLNKPIQITTPRMSMEIVGLSYDSQRKGGTMRAFTATDDNNKPRKSYLPVPYNINFELSIFTKLEDDMFQIVEQILPYFQPHYTITITLIEEINEKRDIKFTLDNISLSDNYEGNFEQRRALIWTLKFTAKTYMFLPLSSSIVKDQLIQTLNGTLNSSTPNFVGVSTANLLPGLIIKGNLIKPNTAITSIGQTGVLINESHQKTNGIESTSISFYDRTISNSVESSIINKVTIGFAAGQNSNTINNDIDIVVTPKAIKNYTGTVVTTVKKDTSSEETLIYVNDVSNLTAKSLIQINNETLYIENVNDDSIKVIRGLYETKPQLHVLGSDVLNITTVDNNLIPPNDLFGFISTFT